MFKKLSKHNILRQYIVKIEAVIIILLAPLLFLLLTKAPQTVSAGWWDDNWNYKTKIIFGNSGSADTDKKVKFDIDTATLITAGKMQSDCGDSRFVTENGQILRYYLDSSGGACNTTSTDYYVLFPAITSGTNVIYHYYGNPQAINGTESSQFSQSTFTPTSGPTSGSEEKTPGPVAHWKFDEGYNTTPITSKLEQQINIMSQTFYTNSGSDIPSDNSLGLIYWDADKYPGATVYFEADMKSWGTNYHEYATLYTSAGSAVSGGELHTSSGSYDRVRSAALTLTDNTSYSVRLRTDGSTAYLYAARLIIIQTNTVKITDTETQIELGNAESQSSDTATQLTNKKIYSYDSSKFSPAPTAYFEASLKTNQPTIEQQINIIDQTYYYYSGSYVPTDNSLGLVHWDADKYSGATVYFEADMKSAGVNWHQYVALYTSAGSAVSGGELHSSSGSYDRVRSAALTLTDETDYTIRTVGDGASYVYAARLIIQQTSTTKITDTETQIELGNAESQSSDTATQLTNKKIYSYDSSKFSPAPTAYFEANLKTNQPTIEQQINIMDQTYNYSSGSNIPTDNSLGLIHWDASKYSGATVYFEADMKSNGVNWHQYATLYTSGGSAVSGSELHTSSGSYDRVRSAALTLTDNTDYTIRVRCDGTANIYAARLVIQQTSTTKITNTETSIEMGNYQTAFTNTSAAELTNSKIYQYNAGAFSPTVESSGDATFSATLKIASSGDTVYAELYNNTNSTVVATVSHTGNTSWNYKTTTNIDGDADWDTTNDDDYVVRVYCSDGGVDGCSGSISNAKIILTQHGGSGITALETMQQEVNSLITDADSTYTSQGLYNRLNLEYHGTQNSFAGGNLNLYYEATLKTSAGTGYAQLYNATNGNAITSSEVSTTSATFARQRSSDITGNLPQYPTFTAKEMDTQIKNNATNTTSVSNSWLVVQVSNLSTTGTWTAYADLYNLTDGTQVSGSEVSSTSITWSRQISSAITLTSGKEYVVRLRSGTNTLPIYLINAKIVLDQTAGGGITALETMQQQVNTLKTDADSTYTSQGLYNRLNLEYHGTQNSFAGGNLNLYYEATLKTSAGTGYAQLYNATDGSAISGSEVSTTSATLARQRSSDITGNLPQYPTFTAKEMDTQIKNSATNTTSVSNSWLVVQVSNLSTTGTWTAYADLYNLTDGTQVSGSEVSTTSITWSRQISSAITLTSGKEYVVRLRSGTNNSSIYLSNAKLILDQSNSCNGITATETIQQSIGTQRTDTDSTYTDQGYLNSYNVGNFNSVNAAYFEATLKTSAGTGYAIFKGSSEIGSSEVSTTSATFTRRRSGDIKSVLPGSATNMESRLKNSASSGNTTTASSSWLVLQVNIIANANVHNSINACYSGVIYGPTWLSGSTCRWGNCLEYDGSNNYVIVSDSPGIDVDTDSYTITAWFKIPVTATTDTILAKYQSTTGTDGGYKIYLDSGGHVIAGMDDDNTWGPDDSVTSIEAYDDNVWHQVAMVKNGQTNLLLYIDGQIIGSDNIITATNTLANTDPLYFGIDGDGSSNAFKGIIDEIKFYPYARTASELKNDYVGGASVLGIKNESPLENGLVGYWKVDENSTPSLDSSGHGNNATWMGNTGSAVGKFGNSLNFDGTYDQASASAYGIPIYPAWPPAFSAWSKRKLIDISNSTGSALTDFQVMLSVTYDSDMQIDFDDLRFTDSTGTQINYWLDERYKPGISASVWVKIPSIASSGTTIHMYYGNGIVTTTSSRNDVFDPTLAGTYISQFSNANIADNHGLSSDRQNNFYISQTGYVNRFNTSWSYQQQYGSLDIYTGLCYDDREDRFYGIDWTNKQWSTFSTSFTETSPMDQSVGDEPIDCATDSTYVYTNHRNGLIKRNLISNNSSSSINMDTLSGFDWGGQGLTYAYGYLFAGTSGSYGANGNRVYLIDISNWSSPIVTDWFDSSGHTLTEVAGLTWKDKYIYQSDRNDDYINKWQGPVKTASVEPTASFSQEQTGALRESISFSAWVNATTLDSSQRMILARGSSPSFDWGIGASATSSGKLWYTLDGLTNTGTSNATLSTGSWNLVTLVSDGVKNKLYINGQYDSETNNSGVLPGSGDISIGSAYNGTQGWDGKIDEVRIYNRALSPAEVSQLYNWAPGPVGYWKMDEGTGTSAYDSSGNGNNSTSFTNNVSWTQGKFGSATKYAGTQDYITVPSDASIDYLPAYTISAWIKPEEIITYNILDKTGGDSTGWSVLLNSNKYQFDVNSDGTSLTCDAPVTGGGEPVANQWDYISFSWDGSGTCSGVKYYKNGVLYPFLTTQSMTGTRDNDTGNNFLIGTNTFSDHFNGAIDDLKIYNYIRTPSQIIEDMNAGHPAPGSPIGSSVLHLEFDEGYGDSAHNTGSGGTSLDGNLYGSCPGDATCPSWTNHGKFNKGLDFERSDSDWVNAGDSSSIHMDQSKSMTFSAWINLESTGLYQNIFRYDDCDSGDGDTNCSRNFYLIRVANDNKVAVNYGPDTASSSISSTSTLSSGNWYHIVFVRDTSLDTDSIYINGILDNSETDTSTGTWETTGQYLMIGRLYNSSDSEYFDGVLDELRIYNSALTTDQIKLLYNQGSSAVMGVLSDTSSLTGGSIASNSASAAYCIPGSSDPCSPPVGEWKFDENTGQITNDSSGNNLSGVLGDTSSVGTDDPAWTNTKNGSGLNFDGINDHVTIEDNDLLTPSNDMTAAIWFKLDQLPSVKGVADYLFHKLNNASPYVSYRCMISSISSDDIICYYCNTSDTVYTVSYTPALSVNTWYHLEFVRSGSNLYLYVNGSRITGSTDVSGNIKNSDQSLYFGGNVSANLNWLGGQLDNFVLYDYARTPAQIAWDYNRGAPVAQYDFDECSGTVLHDTAPKADRSTTGYSGTIYSRCFRKHFCRFLQLRSFNRNVE